MLLFRTHYNKALRVINSCETYYQASNAERYIQLLVNLYSTNQNGVYKFDSDRIVKHINYLNQKIIEKKSELS
tara:strand:- start:1068 stop:1286 length:219 start_codon:yes stop_codon:yes gene_type:complete